VPGIAKKVRDLLSFLSGLAVIYHEMVITADPPGPRIDLLVIACLLLGIAPATITNRWLGGDNAQSSADNEPTKKKPDEQESNAAR
jgi:hypothetical protein